MKRSTIILISVLVMSCAAGDISGDVSGNKDALWPCFHGQRRDNISDEKGLARSWPADGPKLLWTAVNIGLGYSSVSIKDGRIFTAGTTGDDTYLVALDMTGKELWRKAHGQSWKAESYQRWAVSYAGSRATPTIDGDTVYHLSEMGRLGAFDSRTGKEFWSRNIMEDFDAPKSEYGYSESVFINGDLVICCPGGSKGYIAALNKNTGKTVWVNSDINDSIGYSSPVAAEIGGVRQIITLSAARIFAVDPKNGRMLWQYPLANKRDNNVADAIVHDGLVYAASGYGKGSTLLRPGPAAGGRYNVTEIWSSELLDNHHGGIILLDGYLYGSGHEDRGWSCMEFKNGRKLWNSPGKGSLTYADGMLYCLDETGQMALVRATPEKCYEISSFRVPRGGKGSFWAHPVVCDGRLYIRHADKLYAYDISGN